MKILKNILPHVCLMLSAVYLTFFILDKYNPGREFLNRPQIKALILVFAILSAIVSILLVRHNRREE